MCKHDKHICLSNANYMKCPDWWRNCIWHHRFFKKAAVPQEIQNYDEVSVFILCSFSGNSFSKEITACSCANKMSSRISSPGACLSINSPVVGKCLLHCKWEKWNLFPNVLNMLSFGQSCFSSKCIHIVHITRYCFKIQGFNLNNSSPVFSKVHCRKFKDRFALHYCGSFQRGTWWNKSPSIWQYDLLPTKTEVNVLSKWTRVWEKVVMPHL